MPIALARREETGRDQMGRSPVRPGSTEGLFGGGDASMLEALLSLPLGGAPDPSRFPAEQRAYAQFTIEVWNEIHSRAAAYPLHAEYADLLRYDYLQLFNTMRYSHLLNRHPALL